MRYRNKAGNEISQEQYDAMQPTSDAGKEVKAGYKPIPGSEEPVKAKAPVKKKKEQKTKKEDE